MKTGALGLLLTLVVTGILTLVLGSEALIAAATFGLLATTLQVISVAAMKPVWSQGFTRVMGRWAAGTLLRLLGVVLIAVAVLIDRELFPPLPAAFGYLGVVVPLLYVELKLIR